MAAANVAIDWLAGRLLAATNEVQWVVVGVLLAQLFLTGLWMALGGLHAAARFAVVAALTGAGASIFWLGIGRRPELGQWLIWAGGIVLTTHALLLPLRALAGWRVDFDPAYHARSPDKSMQLRLIHLIAFTAACALPLAVVRMANDYEMLAYVFAFAGVGLVVSAPIAWLTLASRRMLRFWPAACGLIFVSLAIDLVVGPLLDVDLEEALVVYLGIAATVLANLGVLRLLFGLRLFSILGPEMEGLAANWASLDPDLALIVAAWPRLPDALRRDFSRLARSVADSLPQSGVSQERDERAD
ncbi:MAG TPA: hypothetical protein VHB99_11990 [Pirellulales bacterium]|nr:hypothetical protein [Pirellulales bacterium]